MVNLTHLIILTLGISSVYGFIPSLFGSLLKTKKKLLAGTSGIGDQGTQLLPVDIKSGQKAYLVKFQSNVPDIVKFKGKWFKKIIGGNSIPVYHELESGRPQTLSTHDHNVDAPQYSHGSQNSNNAYHYSSTNYANQHGSHQSSYGTYNPNDVYKPYSVNTRHYDSHGVLAQPRNAAHVGTILSSNKPVHSRVEGTNSVFAEALKVNEKSSSVASSTSTDNKASIPIRQEQLGLQDSGHSQGFIPIRQTSGSLHSYGNGYSQAKLEDSSSSKGFIPIRQEHAGAQDSGHSEGFIPIRQEHAGVQDSGHIEGFIPIRQEHAGLQDFGHGQGFIPIRQEHAGVQNFGHGQGFIPIRQEHAGVQNFGHSEGFIPIRQNPGSLHGYEKAPSQLKLVSSSNTGFNPIQFNNSPGSIHSHEFISNPTDASDKDTGDSGKRIPIRKEAQGSNDQKIPIRIEPSRQNNLHLIRNFPSSRTLEKQLDLSLVPPIVDFFSSSNSSFESNDNIHTTTIKPLVKNGLVKTEVSDGSSSATLTNVQKGNLFNQHNVIKTFADTHHDIVTQKPFVLLDTRSRNAEGRSKSSGAVRKIPTPEALLTIEEALNLDALSELTTEDYGSGFNDEYNLDEESYSGDLTELASVSYFGRSLLLDPLACRDDLNRNGFHSVTVHPDSPIYIHHGLRLTLECPEHPCKWTFALANKNTYIQFQDLHYNFISFQASEKYLPSGYKYDHYTKDNLVHFFNVQLDPRASPRNYTADVCRTGSSQLKSDYEKFGKFKCCQPRNEIQCGRPHNLDVVRPFGPSLKWTVFIDIVLNSNESLLCKGVLIAPKWVLARASCFANDVKSIAGISAILPRSNGFLDREDILVEEIFLHPLYIAQHDVALIKLASEASKLPICLPSYQKSNPLPSVYGNTALVIAMDKHSVQLLHHEELETLKDNVECNEYVEGYLPRHTFCTTSKTENCVSDSILVNVTDNTLIGINYKDLECSEKTKTFTSVSHFMPWISNITGIAIPLPLDYNKQTKVEF